MKTGNYHSSGKLLLSGEYLVLYGAKALAVPLKFGQWLSVSEGSTHSSILWRSKILGKDWFNADFHLPDMEIKATSGNQTAEFLRSLLQACASLCPEDFSGRNAYNIQTELDFDIRWGLGSSSSLLSNLAWWLDIDPYQLFRKVFPGSGYDVYCARAKKPILFQLAGYDPLVEEVDFFPVFKDKLHFIYLGKKQDTQKSVSSFRSSSKYDEQALESITRLTERMIYSKNLDDFIHIMHSHEEILSSVLNMQTAGKELFPDFHGAVKSLGAWGGDFIMAASHKAPEEVKKYFHDRGFEVIFRYDELVAGF